MAKAKVKAVVDPFAEATPKAAKEAGKGEHIIVAQDITCYNGKCYTKSDIVSAMTNYAHGHELEKQAKAMTSVNRPLLLDFARSMFARNWLANNRNRPSNPTIYADETGNGVAMGAIFQNSIANLDEVSYPALANLIGVKAAEEYTTKGNEFTINPAVLDREITLKQDGKEVKQTVLESIKVALQEKFADYPEILSKLFTVKSHWNTVAGLIDAGPKLVCPDDSPPSQARLAQFLEVGRFVTQLKPSTKGK